MSKGHGGSGHKAQLGHVSPPKELLGVWAALIVLTVVTVEVTRVDLGSLNLWLALLIASVKATLVALFFMHLRYDRPIIGIVFVTSIFLVSLFVGIALMDTEHYSPELIPGYAPAVQQPPPK